MSQKWPRVTKTCIPDRTMCAVLVHVPEESSELQGSTKPNDKTLNKLN